MLPFGGSAGSKLYQYSEPRSSGFGGILLCVGLSGSEYQIEDARGENLFSVQEIFWGSELF